MNANERLKRPTCARLVAGTSVEILVGNRAKVSRASATRPGMTRRLATGRHDQPTASAVPTYAGPDAIPRLPPIPCHPIPRPCSATAREVIDRPGCGWRRELAAETTEMADSMQVSGQRVAWKKLE